MDTINYITQVDFCSSHYKDRFSGFESIIFLPGVNILAGPNGSGKSTILSCLNKGESISKEIKFTLANNLIFNSYYFDFEHSNPRVKAEFTSISQAVSCFQSHGETVKRILQFLSSDEAKRCLILLDEPEQALDLDGMVELIQLLQTTEAAQVVVATHAPELILNDEFNLIELQKGYKIKVRSHILDLLMS